MRKLVFTAITLALVLGSCSNEQLEQINTSPNAAPDASLELLVNGALVGTIQPMSGENARLAGMWAQQFTGEDRQYSGFQSYTITQADFSWTGYYYSMSQQSDLAIEKAVAAGNDFYLGITHIVKGMALGTVAALFEEAPFTQANDFENFPNPTFDDQLTIYTGVENLLDDAIEVLERNQGVGDFANKDFFYSGDAASWIRVAHTLKARYYLHNKEYSSALAEAQDGIMLPENDMLAPHAGNYNLDMNLYFSFGVFDRPGYMTATNAYLPTILDEVGQTADGVQTGLKNNAKTDESERFAFYYSGYGDEDGDGNIDRAYDLNYGGAYGRAASFPMVTAVENLLIMAECYSQGGDDDMALEKLNEVRALHASTFAATYDAYVLTDFDAGGIADYGRGSVTDNLYYEIILEKYASLVGQIEVFNDLRRTKNLIGLVPTNGTQLPERFLTPQDEIDGNPNAYLSGTLFEPTAVNR